MENQNFNNHVGLDPLRPESMEMPHQVRHDVNRVIRANDTSDRGGFMGITKDICK